MIRAPAPPAPGAAASREALASEPTAPATRPMRPDASTANSSSFCQKRIIAQGRDGAFLPSGRTMPSQIPFQEAGCPYGTPFCVVVKPAVGLLICGGWFLDPPPSGHQESVAYGER